MSEFTEDEIQAIQATIKSLEELLEDDEVEPEGIEPIKLRIRILKDTIDAKQTKLISPVPKQESK